MSNSRPKGNTASEACARAPASLEVDHRDVDYERGYQQHPEETTDIQAMLPHLPIPPDDWT